MKTLTLIILLLLPTLGIGQDYQKKYDSVQEINRYLYKVLYAHRIYTSLEEMRRIKTHEIVVNQVILRDITDGLLSFIVTEDYFDYKKGDILRLLDIENDNNTEVTIKYIYHYFGWMIGLRRGYCVIQFE